MLGALHARRLYFFPPCAMEARKKRSVRQLLSLAYARPTNKERRDRIQSADLPGAVFDAIVVVVFIVLAIVYLV